MLSFVIGFLTIVSAGQNIYTLGEGGNWTGFIWSVIIFAISLFVILYIIKKYNIKKCLDEETEEF